MKIILASIVYVLAAAAGGNPQTGRSDLTVRTRSTYGARRGAGPVETVTLQLKGARQRYVRQTTLSSGVPAFSTTEILQCDLGRVVFINDLAKLYSTEPIRSRTGVASGVVRRGGALDTHPVVETQIIDAVDTGERRAVGPVTARHVVTTTTIERDGAPSKVVGIRDGWYIDVSRTCDDSDTMAVLIAGSHAGRVDVKWRGTAKTGFPIEERDRLMDSGGASRIELLDASTAPIPAAAFDVPEGYHPALPLPGGGYDLTRPDTIRNRISALWSFGSSWVSSFWR